jgi:hypothetical protein
MKSLVVAAALLVTSFAPVLAQSAGSGVAANVKLNQAAIDPQQLASLRCKLGFVNPRACIQRPTPSQRPDVGSGRGDRTGIAPGARRP